MVNSKRHIAQIIVSVQIRTASLGTVASRLPSAISQSPKAPIRWIRGNGRISVSTKSVSVCVCMCKDDMDSFNFGALYDPISDSRKRISIRTQKG